jgi:arsenite-transporting ATPase
VADSYFKTWKSSQKKYHRLIEEGFSPLPILDMPLLEREVVGLTMLEKMAQKIYGQEDPTRVYYKGRAQDIRKENGRYVLTLKLPFTSKDKISLTQGRDELDIKVASYRRNIVLPHLLRGLSVSGARFEENRLKISFGSDTTEKSGKDKK